MQKNRKPLKRGCGVFNDDIPSYIWNTKTLWDTLKSVFKIDIV